jgi:hypothetical protein
MKIILKKKKSANIFGRKIALGNNFTLASHYHKPAYDASPQRYKFTIRPNDIKKFRFYATQVSAGCIHIHWCEVK